jgi:anhydro-N-acetylmuramic acid kinase
MSGTSADGIDAVLLELPGWPGVGQPGHPPELGGPAPRGRILAHQYVPYSDELRENVLVASRDEARTSGLTQLHWELGFALAEGARELAADADLIASHGQTVHHIPGPDASRGWRVQSTLQLGEAAVIAEVTGKPVVSDFRPPDMAAGGQAAPLVPFADRILYAEAGVRRAVHNLGGISNLTYLPGLSAEGVIAFDTGPANALIDEAAELLNKRFDEGGRLAAGGRVADTLLEAWRRDPYLSLEPPKSTGREHWNLQRLAGVFELEPRDIAASVTTFTSWTIADAYRRFVLPHGLDEVVVAGGGAFNPVLMGQLRDLLAPIPVLTFEERGWNSAAREAAAFAVLGYHAYQGGPNTLPHTTGARHAVIAGKITRPPLA